MAVTSEADGTQTATVTTEHTLAALEVTGVFVLEVDMNAMAAGDVVELRIKKMTRTGGTVRVFAMQTYFGVQPPDDIIKRSIPVSADLTDTDSLVFTLKQTFGTGRAFPWKVQKHA